MPNQTRGPGRCCCARPSKRPSRRASEGSEPGSLWRCGISGVDAAIFVEEWAAVSPDFVISMAGPLIALTPVYQVGTPEQVERFVRPFLAYSGAPLAAMAFSEPE